MLCLDTTTSTFTFQAGLNPGANIPIAVTFFEQVLAQQLKQVASELSNPQVQTSQMATGGTTKITCLDAPASGYKRLVKSIFLKNASASSIAYTFRYEDSAKTVTAVPLTWTLAAGDNLVYEDGKGWLVTDSSGYSK